MCSTTFLLYMIISSMETKQHLSVHVAPIQGALEDAEANRPLWEVKIVLYRLSGVILESASIHF